MDIRATTAPGKHVELVFRFKCHCVNVVIGRIAVGELYTLTIANGNQMWPERLIDLVNDDRGRGVSPFLYFGFCLTRL